MLTQVSSHLTSQIHPALTDDYAAIQKAAQALVQILGGYEGVQHEMAEKGLGAQLSAWSHGDPKALSPSSLHAVLGRERLSRLANYAGLSQAQTLMGLSGYLPFLMIEESVTA